MSWWKRKQKLQESKAAPIVEPGAQTMQACITSFEGTEIIDPAAFCQYMRINGIGYFASGYSGSLESMKEKDRAMYAQQLRDAVNTWTGMRMSERAMYKPENDAMLKTSVPSSAMGQLVRGRESESGEGPTLECVVNLCEAEVDREKREIRCHVISEGKGNARDRRYYGEDAIYGVAKHLNGARSFINHPGRKEEMDRPEGDLWDQCGFWKHAKVVEVKGKKTVRAVLVCDKSAAGDEALAKAEAAIEYAREFPGLTEVYAGISINGQGEIEQREIDGETVNFVTEVTSLPRADVVTQPARGGKFLSLVESIRSTNKPEGVAIMKDAIKKALASFVESCNALVTSKEDVDPQKVVTMLSESLANVKNIAKTQEGGETSDTTEADSKETEDKEKEDDEDEGKESKASEMEDDEEDEDEEEMDESKTKPSKESKARESKVARENRELRKELKESNRRLKSIEGKVSLSETAEAIKEAGLEGFIDAKDLADIPAAQRRSHIKMLKAMRESMPFGVPGTTVRGVGAGNSGKPGAAFMGTFKSVGTRRAGRA